MSTPVIKLDRRNFLKGSAMVAGGLVLGFYLPDANEAEAQSTASSAPVRMNAFIQIASDDTVTMTIHKPEFGQGTVTSLSMLLAEELECDWKKVKTQFADTIDPMYMMGAPIQGVYGSTAIRTSWIPSAERERSRARCFWKPRLPSGECRLPIAALRTEPSST